ncbi:MAG: MBL fold metallo-hydrolase [Pseudomonas sp.]|uniref:MBL fold metallo-hydrolase n=1 Tax=Pseudomonas sp. TaxID=306 RepID=UPI00339132C6
MTAQLEAFYDPATSTVSYLIYPTPGGACAIIDAVLDYDAASGRTATASAERIIQRVRQQRLEVHWLLETHAHADHLSAAAYLRERLGGRIGIGAGIRDVQQRFQRLLNLQPSPLDDPLPFDHLFEPGELFQIGGLQARALHVPGHTPADMAYQVENDWVFVGDTLFMPDVGSARCDFPGGDPHQLYRSIRRLLELPPATRLFMCHDYPPEGRGPCWESSVDEQRRANIHVHDGIDEATFVAMRTARDRQLSMPTLILPAIQINLRGGRLPNAEANGIRYLKIPLDAL